MTLACGLLALLTLAATPPPPPGWFQPGGIGRIPTPTVPYSPPKVTAFGDINGSRLRVGAELTSREYRDATYYLYAVVEVNGSLYWIHLDGQWVSPEDVERRWATLPYYASAYLAEWRTIDAVLFEGDLGVLDAPVPVTFYFCAVAPGRVYSAVDSVSLLLE